MKICTQKLKKKEKKTMEIIRDRDKFIKERSNESFFIEAGAGAGKSTTMVNKIVDNILSGIKPERIVAITFTNKSAEDLLIRVTEKVNQARLEASGEDKVKLDNAFYSLYKMKISTIHSFCYKILSEYSFDAEIPFGTQLIEEDDIAKLSGILYEKWYQTLSSTDLNRINSISNAIDSETSSNKAQRKIRDTYDFLVDKYFPDMNIVNVEQINLDVAYDYAKKLFNFINKDVHDGYLLTNNAQVFMEGKIEPFFNKYPNPISPKDEQFYEYYHDLVSLLSKPPKKPYKKSPGLDANSQNDLYLNFAQPWSDILDNLSLYFNKDINDYAIEAYNYYQSHRESGVITNNELIYKTYCLITQSKEACQKIASQYDVIYVDEFQDTDDYQIKLIKALALEMDARKKPNSIGSLIVVGDPKQSIYRFRGADFKSYIGFKDIFKSLEKKGETTYSVVSLPDNFRSSSIILKWVNDTYKQMTFYSGYEYKDMEYPKNHELIDYQDEPKALAGVYLHDLHDGKSDYDNTAELVDYLVKNKYKIMVPKDPKTKGTPYIWKEIEYKDFMIIFSGKTHLNDCARAFDKRGIHYDITGKLDVASLEGVRQLVRIINYLLIPDEDNKKTALEILSHHFSDIETINEQLDNLINQTKNMSNYGKVYYVFNHYSEYVPNMNTIETKSIQSSIYQILEALFQKDNMSAVQIMDEIFRMTQEYQSTALAVSREDNAVKIMNAHQTKGLEANIVIYLTAYEIIDTDSSEILDGTIYLNCLKQHKDIKDLCKSQILEECLRKEYVVATRARQVMIFDSELLTAKSTRLFHIESYPYDWSNLENYHINALPEDTSIEIVNNDDPFVIGKKDIIDDVNEPLYLETTPSQLEKRKNPEPKEDELPKNDVHRPMNSEFGTMLHRCNELYARNPSCLIDEIVDIAMRENDCDSNYTRKYLRKCLFATKDLFMKNKMFDAVLEPEFKFYYYINKESQTPILMNGSIDLLMKKDNVITIIDFKSDAADYINKEQFEKVLKENYQPQLEAYKAFCEQIYPNYQIDMEIIWYEEINDMVTAHSLKI